MDTGLFDLWVNDGFRQGQPRLFANPPCRNANGRQGGLDLGGPAEVSYADDRDVVRNAQPGGGGPVKRAGGQNIIAADQGGRAVLPAQKIKRLERELEDEKLRNLILNKAIDISDTQYGTSIRKKLFPKLSDSSEKQTE
mgnify:CR=1 FL=1